jgi:hypothetical protein
LEDVKTDDSQRTITGRAIVYNSMSTQLRTTSGDTFREIILPGALDDSLKNNDIIATREHNPELLLGRTSAGTLSLENRDDGIHASINVPETSYGNDTLVSAKRGDLKGFSFIFNKPQQRLFSRSGEKIREISKMNVREVSLVSNPAYPDAKVEVCRSEDFVEENLTKTKEEERASIGEITVPVVVEVLVKTETSTATPVDMKRYETLIKLWEKETYEADPRANNSK